MSLASHASLLQAAAASGGQSSSSDDETDREETDREEGQEEAPEYLPDDDASDDDYCLTVAPERKLFSIHQGLISHCTSHWSLRFQTSIEMNCDPCLLKNC